MQPRVREAYRTYFFNNWPYALGRIIDPISTIENGEMAFARGRYHHPRGGFHFLPGKEHHYAFTTSRTIVQINGNGPFDINYVNPDDDPQKAKM